MKKIYEIGTPILPRMVAICLNKSVWVVVRIEQDAVAAVHGLQEVITSDSHVIESWCRIELCSEFLFDVIVDIDTTELVGECHGACHAVAHDGHDVAYSLHIVVETFYFEDTLLGKLI